MASPSVYIRSQMQESSFLTGRDLARGFCSKLLASADSLAARAAPWYPYAALQQLLMFEGLLTQAADLAVLTSQAYGNDGDSGPGFTFANESFPIDDALMCVGFKGESPGPYLARASASVVQDSILSKRLSWLQSNIDTYPLWRLTSGYREWGEATVPVKPAYAQLVERLDRATASQARKLWTAAYEAKDPKLGAEIHARFGLVTPFWYVASWYAGWQVRWGDVDGAQQSILVGLEIPMPYSIWDLCLPYGAVLQPSLSNAMTVSFCDDVLSRRGDKLPW